MNFPVWIFEVPHQRPASGWKCETAADLAEAAHKAAGDLPCGVYIYATTAELEHSAGDREDFPAAWAAADKFGFPLAEVGSGDQHAEWMAAADAPDENAVYLEMLGHDLHSLTVCTSIAELIDEALNASGHGAHQVQAAAERLIADEIGSDRATVELALAGIALDSDDEDDLEDFARVQDVLARPMAEYRETKAAREAESTKFKAADDARRAVYEARVDAWRAGLDASTRERIAALLTEADQHSGRRRKRLREKARALEKMHGRPEYA